ncbi:MAG: DUF192 domain-containing protein [Chromatiales bacterium]|jgi:uncharacterized membrane protein (UPF0127 family)|nr:DUF192 domain-containing protein [Chromatiales bacterium]
MSRPLALLLLLLAGLPAFAQDTATRLAGFPRGQVILVTSAARCLQIDAWFAESTEQRGRGLMYVDQMGEFEGMWFSYPEPAVIVMWMKNTVLPLDMVFVGRDGRVARIAADTVPWSEERISSGGPATGVLELNAGFAARWGLARGDRVVVMAP